MLTAFKGGMHQKFLRIFVALVVLILSIPSTIQAAQVGESAISSRFNSVELNFNISMNGDSAARSIIAAYGRPAQLRYISKRPGTKSWRLEFLALPDISSGVPDAVKVKIKMAEPTGSVWRIVQESEMILAPGRVGSLTAGKGGEVRSLQIVAKSQFNLLSGLRTGDSKSCPDILQSEDDLTVLAGDCCGGSCANGDGWQCCGAIACCNCDSCCTNSAEPRL